MNQEHRKIVSALFLALSLLFCSVLSPVSSLSEEATMTPAESTAMGLTYAHFALMTVLMVPSDYPDEESCFNEMALLELHDHGYGDYPAYRSHDNLWDAVFIPDANGKITMVHLLSTMTKAQGSGVARNAFYHVEGLCSPYWSLTSNSEAGASFARIYGQALAFTSSRETEQIDFNGVKISCYRNGESFGIILEYPDPVDEEAIFNKPYALVILASYTQKDQ